MTKQKSSDPVEQGLVEIGALMSDPHSPRADKVCEEMVRRYSAEAQELFTRNGLLAQSDWPAWHRLLQVRFIQRACADRPNVEAVVRRELGMGKRPRPDRLMAEVIRECFIETIAWGNDNKHKPKDQQTVSPKRPDLYWKEAVQSLDEDLTRERSQGRQIADCPPRWYSVLKIDYSLKSVPN